MASQLTKMVAVLALLALCASAATAALVPQYTSPSMATGAMEPCMQYCMMQQAFTLGGITSPQAMTMLQQPLQQCGMMMPSMMTMLQSNCGTICQMMQQQQYMSMAVQLPFTFGVMTPSAFYQQPFVGGAFFQQPFMGCAF